MFSPGQCQKSDQSRFYPSFSWCDERTGFNCAKSEAGKYTPRFHELVALFKALIVVLSHARTALLRCSMVTPRLAASLSLRQGTYVNAQSKEWMWAELEHTLTIAQVYTADHAWLAKVVYVLSVNPTFSSTWPSYIQYLLSLSLHQTGFHNPDL